MIECNMNSVLHTQTLGIKMHGSVFVIFTAKKVKFAVFRVATPCSDV